MFKQIKQLFSTFNDQPNQMQEHDLKTAVAALLIEVMRADTQQQDDELKTLTFTLKKYFQLTDEEVDELMQSAGKSLDEAIDYFQFSKQINNQCSAQQRIEIIELLWRLAYADGELDPQEEYVIRRVANLLYVTHEDFIAAKLAATKL
ncbi:MULTISPECIES: TerB family tellurite resistance protein [unclassified Pseudoalteromonas]|uniref:tellurite resistance TerB family protein n=1 Tax=unclassified Pseudoalteromonas TaxID=194690 RepID=UPI0025B49878|nr:MULTISPECIES: TerB family tellurite resistance protein [unclassified Pseudoalteromonas]MDN3378512.1 TerB family tellurite resistance protein [Pseudoalteromonas sp. APC 3893]MDN3387075.1 TerB family tellurite resistance protein [Pseudoalteromonas sp. APC 4017]